MSKIIVYTCNIGNYDSFYEINYDSNKYHFVYFTDNKRIKSSSWEIRYIDPNNFDCDYKKISRYIKTHPHEFFSEYDISIWVDAACQNLNFPVIEKFLKQIQESPNSMLLSKHPSRDCLYDEMNACIQWGKGNPDVMKKQIAGYKKEKFPAKFGLVETGLMIRNHNDKKLQEHHDVWWNEIKTKSIRDQLSFNYAVWKTDFKYDTFNLRDRLMMVKFTFHGKGYKKKEKVLYAGPWFGEFGWELFAWQGYIRKKANDEYWDEVVVATRPGHEYLYEDFADRILTSDPPGVRGGPLLNGKAPQFNIKNTSNKDLHIISPSIELCHRIAIEQKEHEYVPYGKKIDTDIDILIHARNINNAGFDFRNWPEQKWNQLVDSLKEKYKIASIGTKEGAMHIEGTEDLRGISLKDLSNYMASVKMVVGPSSGPMHLASLSQTKHIVWTDDKSNLLGRFTNRQRYESVWNPFKTESIVIDNQGWDPSVESVVKSIDIVLPVAKSKDQMDRINDILDSLKTSTPFALVRFNDGEMGGVSKEGFVAARGDQIVNKALREKLIESLEYKAERYWIGIPCHKCFPAYHKKASDMVGDYEYLTCAVVTTNRNWKRFVEELPVLIKDKNVVWVSGEDQNLEALKEKTGIVVNRHIKVPSKNSFGVYNDIVSQNDFDAGDIVILSCGPLSRVLVYDWYKDRKDVTFLDVGSAFDPYTRNVWHKCHNGTLGPCEGCN